ncbi:transglycosylase SLT domain-containing protein [Thermodesulfobacteriota bacterium]
MTYLSRYKIGCLWLLIASSIFCIASPSAISGVGEEIPMSSEWRIPSTVDLPEMMNATALLVGVAYSQTNFFFSPDGRKFGFELKLLKDYEAFLNKGRGPKKLPIVMGFVPMPHNRLIPALLEGYCDIAAAGLTVTDWRRAKVDFTEPYVSDIKELLITHKDVKGLRQVEDLSGKQVYVRESSSYYDSLTKLNAVFGTRKRLPINILKADETLNTESILEMVNAGIVKITVADSHIGALWSNVLPKIRVHENLQLRQGGRLAWMVRKSNPELKASLNTFIKGHKKGTLKGNIYFKRYFEDTRWIKNPTTKANRKRMAQYESWFKKYGQKYNVDWVLISSIAFHESGMDPSVRSRAGALGLMQVLPIMARDKRIAVRNIHLPENNIHAGAKYLALLRDTYFSDPAISSDDRLRFSLAAYNAGPRRIQQVRKLAEKRGYDPNRWFGHCEVAALNLIGQETVRYVRNINIYYVAFKLFLNS